MCGGLYDFEIAGIVADQERNRIALANADLIQRGRRKRAPVKQRLSRHGVCT
jgi:hypothetical protein